MPDTFFKRLCCLFGLARESRGEMCFSYLTSFQTTHNGKVGDVNNPIRIEQQLACLNHTDRNFVHGFPYYKKKVNATNQTEALYAFLNDKTNNCNSTLLTDHLKDNQYYCYTQYPDYIKGGSYAAYVSKYGVSAKEAVDRIKQTCGRKKSCWETFRNYLFAPRFQRTCLRQRIESGEKEEFHKKHSYKREL